MATAQGTNAVNTISQRIVEAAITDQAYTNNNAFYYRLANGGRKVKVPGGTQYEVPVQISKWTNGGAYSAFEIVDVAPNDTLVTAAWDPRGYSVPVSVDDFTLAKWNSPQAIANGLSVLWEAAAQKMADDLGTDLHTDGSNTKKIDGTKGAVDDAGVLVTYGGISRNTYTNWRSTEDASTATLTLTSLRTALSNGTIGGHAPSIILTRKEQYNRLWSLLVANQQYNAAQDTGLAAAGFRHLLFDGLPVVIDDAVFDGPNSSNGAILMLDESAWDIVIFKDTDFQMEEFRQPINQHVWVGHLKWMGNVICRRPRTQVKLTNISA